MRRTLMALTFMVAAFQAAAASLAVTARVEPESALPGIPVRVVLTVANAGDTPQTLPRLWVIQARNESGLVFIPEVLDFPVKALPEEYDERARTLNARETKTFEVPLGTTLTSGAMADPRLWEPGTYTVQVFLNEKLRANDIYAYGLGGLLGAGRISAPLLPSSTATLRIEKPTGIDAEIWTTIREKTNNLGFAVYGEVEADALVNALWARAGQSAYMPYLLGYMRYTPRETLEARRDEVVKRNPQHPVAEGIRIGRAQMKVVRARAAMYAGSSDLESVLEQVDEARAELSVLQTDVRQDVLRVQARKSLLEIAPREKWIEEYREVARPRHQ